MVKNKYCKVASSRPVYYSILETLGQSSQYKSIINILNVQYGCATNQNTSLLDDQNTPNHKPKIWSTVFPQKRPSLD